MPARWRRLTVYSVVRHGYAKEVVWVDHGELRVEVRGDVMEQ